MGRQGALLLVGLNVVVQAEAPGEVSNINSITSNRSIRTKAQRPRVFSETSFHEKKIILLMTIMVFMMGVALLLKLRKVVRRA